MNLEAILNEYRDDTRIASLIQTLQDKSAHTISLQGLVGSANAVVAATVFPQIKSSHLFILNDKEEAAYFQNNLKNLLPGKDIFFFPDSFKKPGHFEHINNIDIQLRAEVVNRLANMHTRGELIVTYPEALFEKVVKKQVLKKNTLHLKIGEAVDIDFMIELLVTYDFERVDFVYEPGQYSIRGGIIDIFSFGNEYPYRVELFANEVESIRLFEPANQRSIRKIAQVDIVPNIQTHFGSTQKTSFFEVLPNNSTVWVQSLQFTIDRLDQCFESAVRMFNAVQQGGAELDLGDADFFKQQPLETFELSSKFVDDIMKYPVVMFSAAQGFKAEQEFSFHTSPQPVFNKNFNLLIEYLNKNTAEGFTNYIFATNPRQIERFYNIFNDMNAEVQFHPINAAIHEGFLDNDLKLACYTDHQIFERYHKYNLKRGFSKDQALMMKTLRELQPGDYVTHIDYGVGRYSGLEKIEVNGHTQEAVRLIYKDNDLLYVNINALHKISKYVGKEGTQPKINKLGTDAWESVKRRTKKKIKDIAEQLIKLYARRKAQPGFAFSKDTYVQTELEASFIYEDTPDQEKATVDIKHDMEQPHPMDRLVCGDVGFGKTEIAIRAAAKAAVDGKQVAVLAPTTILTSQHEKTFADRFKDFPFRIELINRFKTTGQKREILKGLEEGQVDILIGTHAILGKQVKWKDLGLIIVDEEQKFGVGAKERLRELKVNVDTLTLTATPIPRTLQFSMMGARDLSVINTPPPNRQPIQTELHVFNEDVVREAITYEVYRGGQVFFVHNRVKDIMDVAGMLKRLCPDVDFGVAHGQMDGKKLEDQMMRFVNREYDVLVSTNIVESGLDIPNANTIIINNAHWFGLSDLHQLRGRVGRSNKKAFCYLFTPPLSTLPGDTRKRLKTIEEFSDLGSGFNIAMRDLDIRGAGNLLGAEQSGFIAEIGYDMYHKILDETIRELKQTEYKEIYKDQLEGQQEFLSDVQIDTDMELHIPDGYVRSVNERLSLYTELNNIKKESDLQAFKVMLTDRFGPMPIEVNELLHAIRLQWVAKRLGFERVMLKEDKMRCFFVENQESFYYETALFSAIMGYIQQNRHFSLKQTNKFLILTIPDIKSIRDANKTLYHMQQQLIPEMDE